MFQLGYSWISSIVYIYIHSHIFGKRLNNPALRVARSIPRFCLLELCSGSCEAEPHCRTNFRGGRRVLLNRRSGEYNSGKIYPRTVANFIIIIPETRVREKKKEKTNRNTSRNIGFIRFFGRSLPLPPSPNRRETSRLLVETHPLPPPGGRVTATTTISIRYCAPRS